jgi:hypothetical protein
MTAIQIGSENEAVVFARNTNCLATPQMKPGSAAQELEATAICR